MNYPKFISKTSTIGIPNPTSEKVDEKRINKYKNAKKNLTDYGFNLNISNNLFISNKGRSASKEERANELMEMIKDEENKVILFASGGDFFIEILPYLDFEEIVNHKKWFIGFSDPSSFLYILTSKYDLATIYGSNYSSFGSFKLYENHNDLLNIIQGKKTVITSYEKYEENYQETITGLEGYKLDTEVIWKTIDKKDIKVEGRLLGGCFDCIADIAGTKYDGITSFNEKYGEDGIIWFFDNCEKSMEEVIRILWRFNCLGYFDNTKAVIFGRFAYPHSYYDYTIEECLNDTILKEKNIPIIYDADISHKALSMPIINGAYAKVECINNKGKIEYKLV